MNEPTVFQAAILAFLETAPNRMASTWTIGEGAFPEQWKKDRARGAMVVQIKIAGYKLVKAGRLECVLPACGQFGAHWLCHPKPSPAQIAGQ